MKAWRKVQEGLLWSHLRGWGRSRVIRTSYLWLFAVPILARFLLPIAGEHTVHIFGKSWVVRIELPFSWTVFYASAITFSLAQALYMLRVPSLIDKYESYSALGTAHGTASSVELEKQARLLLGDICAALDCWPRYVGYSPREGHSSIPQHQQVTAAYDDLSKEDKVVFEEAIRECEPIFRLVTHLRCFHHLSNLMFDGAGSRAVAVRIASATNPGALQLSPYASHASAQEIQARLEDAQEQQASSFWLLHQFADRTRKRTRLACALLFLVGFLLFLVVALEGAWSVVQVVLA